jgi:hypothetical protein
MPKELGDLEFRILRKEEVAKVISKKTKPLIVEQFAQKFIDPETNAPIQVGEGIEIGPFESENEGRNWLRYYLPDTYKHPLLGWGKVRTKGDHIKSPVSVEPKPRDGKHYFWVIRITE